MESYDVIIVGSGSSGGALAGRLTAHSDKRVLVLEGGPVYGSVDEMPPVLLDPSTLGATAPGHPNAWTYMAATTPGTVRPLPRGKGLGGSSSINGAYFIRGTADDFDAWGRAGNDEWTYEKVLPVFRRIESDKDFAGEYHGSDGPIPVSREADDRAPEITNAFVDACLGLGFPDDPDKNAPSAGGVGLLPKSVYGGLRVGTALGYLIPALSRPNLTIVGNAVVNRVIFEGRRAVGVEARVDGELRIFRGDEIVLSAGALRTPQILMLSGVGPADELTALGIPLVQDLPGVGRELSDHPAVRAAWDSDIDLVHLPGRTNSTSVLHWTGEAGSDIEIIPGIVRARDLMGRRDAAGQTPSATPPSAAPRSGTPAPSGILPDRALLYVTVQQEESRGTVSLRSADPDDAPVISFNLLTESVDSARLREGVRMAHEIFQTSAMKEIGARLLDIDGATIADDTALDRWVRDRVSAIHPCCTCRMGPASDPLAVVDQYLRVHGVEGLRVADTSIYPTITSRGPNATAVMIGDRLADFLA